MLASFHQAITSSVIMTVILGGGIGGLSAAFYLSKYLPGQRITLVEATSRVGGWIKTSLLPDGVRVENGPRSIRTLGEQGTNTLNLLQDLHLSDKIRPIRRSHPGSTKRLVYARSGLHELPSSLVSFFKPTSLFTYPLVVAVINDIRAPQHVCEDENAYEFISRRLGKDIAEYVVAPLHCGVCAGDARQISAKMLLRNLFEAEQKHGAIFLGLLKNAFTFKLYRHDTNLKPRELAKRSMSEKWSFYSIEGGIENFPKALHQNLLDSGVEIIFNDKCCNISLSTNDSCNITLASGKKLTAKHVISALPAKQLAPLINSEHSSLANLLNEQKTVTIAVVHLRYQGDVLKHKAFGFLSAPPYDESPLLGVTFDSVTFPNDKNDTVLTVMIGGKWYHPRFSNATKDELADFAVENIQKILEISSEPIYKNVSILQDCIPQYTVGHYERVNAISDYLKENQLPLHLIGSSYNGVGINDVIMSSYKAVQNMKQTKPV